METAIVNKKPEVNKAMPNTVPTLEPAAVQPPRSYDFFQSVKAWVLPPVGRDDRPENLSERIDWLRAIPFFGMHLACALVYFVGWSWLAIGIAVFLYGLRVFALTGFYHRYFSHRTFKTWRIIQFLFAAIGCMAIQRGPLWWAAHHRNHHIHSDDPDDLHSPKQKGILWAHMLWFLTPRAQRTRLKLIPDFAKYPELRFLDRWELLPPALMGLALYGLGEFVAWEFPAAGVTGWQLVIWGVFVSTIAVSHVTFLVNSATHLIGTPRYKTLDDSKNSMIVALLTFGEGWHNNHHYYPNSTRQGFFWWEIDVTYYILTFMSMLHLVWDLKPVPERILYPLSKKVEEPEYYVSKTPTTTVS